MKNGWIYALSIWISSVFIGSFFVALYIDLGEGDGLNAIFQTYYFSILISGINSIPTAIVFILCLEFLSTYNIIKKKLFGIICSLAYILCFITVFIYFFRKNDVLESLTDPFLWIIFLCYCAGLTSGTYLFSKWHIVENKSQTTKCKIISNATTNATDNT